MKRSDAVKGAVSMIELLFDYGYLQSNIQRKQQFRCDLHGDTRDDRPSARVYPEDDHAYCFACGKSRDVIGWVMEKEGLSFTEACRFLERRFNLPAWKYDTEEVVEEPLPDPEFNRIENIIRMILDSKIVDVSRAAILFDVLDRLKYAYQRGESTEKVSTLLEKLRLKAMGQA
jgi:DNA primase